MTELPDPPSLQVQVGRPLRLDHFHRETKKHVYFPSLEERKKIANKSFDANKADMECFIHIYAPGTLDFCMELKRLRNTHCCNFISIVLIPNILSSF